MKPEILQAVLPGIVDELAGRAVTRVDRVGSHGVWVRFGGTRRSLFLSAHPQHSRLGLLAAPPAGEARAAPDNLAKPLKGAVLTGAEQEAGGRVARLRFRAEEARHPEPWIAAELIPRFANLVLVGNEDRILWAEREFTGPDRPREVAPGKVYRAPAGKDEPAREPSTPMLARDPETGTLRLLTSGDDVPASWETESGDPNEIVDRYYRFLEEDEASRSLLAGLRRVLVRRRKHAAKALRKIEKRLEETGREAEIRRQAEILTAHLGEARRGQTAITLPDFDGVATVEIPLDPQLDPRANADALFRRARKLSRGREQLETQRAIQEAEIAEADRALDSLDPVPEAEELRGIVEKHAPSLLDGKKSPGPGKSAGHKEPERHPSLPEGFQPRVYDLPGGWVVWVGRDSRQNDELTHRRASQKDLWFHARGAQGSHTVLRISSGKGEPSKEVILQAAAIAAFHSKARNSGLVPVAYTEKRYVRRARGAPAGTAVMIREKVVMVRPELPA